MLKTVTRKTIKHVLEEEFKKKQVSNKVENKSRETKVMKLNKELQGEIAKKINCSFN